MKKALAAFVLLLLIVLGAWRLSNARSYQLMGHIVARTDTDRQVVALTFDDGPTDAFTDDVLAVLRDRGVRATFFVTGRETEANREAARAIVAAGHALGNHSYTHPQMVLMAPGTVAREIERTDAAIRAAGYEGPIYFRPPYGKKLLVLPWYLSRHGRTTVTWDVEPESYPEVRASAEGIVAHVLERVTPGSIVLLHLMYESRATSREALPLLIDGLRQQGYAFVTVPELLGDE